jgi:hypothetical protein
MMKLTHILGILAVVAGSALVSGCALQPGEETSAESSSAALETQNAPADPGQQAGGPVNPIDHVATGEDGNPQGPTPWPWRSFEEGAAERPPIPDPGSPLVDVAQQKTK